MSQPTQTRPVRIVEVGPRDGLQNVKQVVPTAIKIDLINRLHDAGLQTVELTSVVSPRAIPQLSDCRTLLADGGVQRLLGDARLRLPVLVANMKGLEVALKQNVREVAVFVSATQGFSKANINCSVQQGLDRAREVAESARKNGLAVRG
jgi:hydroxymethylglutaryl-CoA lyase